MKHKFLLLVALWVITTEVHASNLSKISAATANGAPVAANLATLCTQLSGLSDAQLEALDTVAQGQKFFRVYGAPVSSACSATARPLLAPLQAAADAYAANTADDTLAINFLNAMLDYVEQGGAPKLYPNTFGAAKAQAQNATRVAMTRAPGAGGGGPSADETALRTFLAGPAPDAIIDGWTWGAFINAPRNTLEANVRAMGFTTYAAGQAAGGGGAGAPNAIETAITQLARQFNNNNAPAFVTALNTWLPRIANHLNSIQPGYTLPNTLTSDRFFSDLHGYLGYSVDTIAFLRNTPPPFVGGYDNGVNIRENLQNMAQRTYNAGYAQYRIDNPPAAPGGGMNVAQIENFLGQSITYHNNAVLAQNIEAIRTFLTTATSAANPLTLYNVPASTVGAQRSRADGYKLLWIPTWNALQDNAKSLRTLQQQVQAAGGNPGPRIQTLIKRNVAAPTINDFDHFDDNSIVLPTVAGINWQANGSLEVFIYQYPLPQ